MQRHQGICVLNPTGADITYPEMMQVVERNVSILAKLGCGRKNGGTLIAVDVSLGWRCIPIFLACLAQELAILPIAAASGSNRTKQILQETKPALLFDRQTVQGNGEIISSAISSVAVGRHRELADVAFLLYTSGTSGQPKGVMLTSANIWANVSDILAYSRFRSKDKILIIRPLTHSSALTGELLAGLLAGSQLCIKEVQMGPLGSLRLLSQLGITILGATPTVAAKLAHFAPRFETALQTVMISGEVPTRKQLDSVRAAFPQAGIWHAYGLTEASPRVSCLTLPFELNGHTCVGPPLRQVQVRIVDDAGNSLPDGETGELLVAGPNVMKGYFRNEAATHQKIQNGWLRTGDLAAMRDGRLFVYGRSDHMLIRAGNNLYPEEIEAVLLRHPKVQEALVFGTRDGEKGHRIHAWVVGEKTLSERELWKYVLETIEDGKLWPDVLAIKPRLPKTESGKLIRPRPS
nr:fatty acid--CoA ligase family protein [Brevibacillus fulvus]